MKKSWFNGILLAALCMTLPALAQDKPPDKPKPPAMTQAEVTLLTTGKRAFQDNLYDLAQKNLTEFMQQFPQSPGRAEAQILLAQTYFFAGDRQKAMELVQSPPPDASDELKPSFDYWAAQCLLAMKKWPDAEDRFRKFIDQNPKSDLLLPARLGLAQALFQNNHPQEAFDLLKDLQALGLKHKVGQQAALARGKMLLASDKTQEAKDIFDQLAQQKPRAPLSYELAYWQGETFMTMGDLDGAIAAYRKVTGDENAFPRSLVADAWLSSGMVLKAKKDWKGASAALIQAMTLTKVVEDFKQAAENFLAVHMSEKTLSSGAITLRDLAKKRGGDAGAEALFAIGRAFQESQESGSLDAAISEFDGLSKAFPESAWAAEAGFMISSALEKKGDLDGAVQSVQNLIDSGRFPHRVAEARMRIAELRFRQGKFDDAAKLYQQALGETGVDADTRQKAMFNELTALFRIGKVDDFLKWQATFAKEFPDNPKLDDVTVMQGRLLKAPLDRQLLLDFVSKKPKSPKAAEALFLAAGSSFYDVVYADSARDYKRIETEYPDSPYAFAAKFTRILSEVRLGTMKSEDALKEFSAMVAAKPDHELTPTILFTTGEIYYGQQNFAAAEEAFNNLVKQFAGHHLVDEAIYYSGKSQMGLGNYEGAIQTFEKLGPDSRNRTLARLAEVDCYRYMANYEAALKIADSLAEILKPNDPFWIDATLKQASILYTMAAKDEKLYDTAIKAAEKVLGKTKEASSAQLNEAGFIKGKSLEKTNHPADALQAYLNVVYGTVLPDLQWPTQPEYHWFIQCGVEAAQMKEQAGDFKAAISIYRIMSHLPGPNQDEFTKKISDLRTRYFIPDDN